MKDSGKSKKKNACVNVHIGWEKKALIHMCTPSRCETEEQNTERRCFEHEESVVFTQTHWRPCSHTMMSVSHVWNIH